MKKIITKMMQFIMLISMVFSGIQTPLVVLADAIDTNDVVSPQKGDIKLGETGKISSTGSVSMTSGVETITNDGDVQIVKTVTKENNDGKYKVEFTIKGQDVETVQQVTKPIYLVIVFDTSGSMICNADNNSYAYDSARDAGRNYGSYTAADGTTIYCSNASGNNSSNILSSKWEGAVTGAVNFSDDLTKMANTNVSVVTFANSASSASAWSQTKLDASAFGHPVGSTNLRDGIETAKAKLDTVTDENAQKYILVVGDGTPTAGGSRNMSATQAAKRAATIAKNDGINIFAIGYGIGTGTTTDSADDKEAQAVLKYVSSNTTVTATDPTGNETGSYEDKGYYHLASTDSISASLTTVFETIGEAAKAGTDATVTDNIGPKFSIVTDDSSTVTYGGSVSETIPEITEEGVKFTFYIQIDREAPTGWYNTNAGFTLTYTDSNNIEQTITYGDDDDEVDPYVYWESYRYQVNYYKDSITNPEDSNFLGSETEVASKDTVITVSDIDKEAYLSEAGAGYEFKLVTPESITINNPLEVPVINVLYTLKEYTYKVEYYYDNILDSSIDEGPVTHGTEVEPSKYYLTSEHIREGYKLDTDNTDRETVVIDRENEVIRIYYIKDNFNYTVNYHFGEEETIDNTDTNNTGSAEFGSVIKPEDKYLSQDKLTSKGYEDYFLNPNKPHLPVGGLTIGADSSKNIIDIYYITTEVENETTTKKADKAIISSSSDLIQYTVNYQANISNVNAGETIVVTIVDTLPKKIDETKSNLNGGVYNSSDNTITWTFNLEVTEFTETYVIDKTVTYIVNYLDFANMSSSLNNMLLNTAKGMVTINSDTSDGSQDEEEVEVAIDGTLIVNHVDEAGNALIPSVTTTNKVGTDYNESKKDIYGYTIKTEPDNKTGKYIEGTITVTFVYSKNTGTVTDNEVEKIGPENITSIDGVFNYTLTYNAKVTDYVGEVTLTLTDKLPYEIDLERSTYDNRCTYNNQTLVCTEVITISENNKTINEAFALALVFKNVNTDKVVNEVTANLVYGEKEVTNDDQTETEVFKGTVIATYKDTAGNVLADEISSTDLAGNEYTTEVLEFLGYTLTTEPTNKTGKYLANEIIYVEYIYSKNVGTSEEELVKTGNNQVLDINKPFEYTITYKTEIIDYVGEVDIEIIDTPEHEIDEEKSLISNNCQFIDGKIVCNYQLNVTNKEDSLINITENLVLYYKNITDNIVNNQVSATLTYGENIKTTDSEWNVEVLVGNVIVNYLTDDGQKLTDSIMTSDLVGKEYQTNSLAFDGYYLKEVIGEETGTYTEETINVTYVYSTIPLPPQTGVNNNFTAYINLMIGIVCLFIFKKRI